MKYYLESDIEEIVLATSKSLEKLEGKVVLITGATGFLGRYFIATLKKFNEGALTPVTVIAIDNHVTSAHVKLHGDDDRDVNIEWVTGDAGIGANLPKKFDYVIHAAGIASPEHYRANPIETINVAVNVTKDLLDRARANQARMLYFSSSEIYGDPFPEFIPTNEDYRGNVSTRGPRACYDESKRLGETLCWIYETYYDVHVSVARPFNIYGPGMMPKDYRVLPNFAASWVKGESLKIYGHGNQTRTFCYITDAVVAFMKILLDGEKPNVYNVGNPKPEISILHLAQMITENIDESIDIEIVGYPSTYPQDEPNRRCPDVSRIKRNLQYDPKIELLEGLERFFAWAKLNYTSEFF